MLVTLNGTIMSGARVPYAMAATDTSSARSPKSTRASTHRPPAIVVQAGAVDHPPVAGRKIFASSFRSPSFAEWLLLHDRRQHYLRLPLARSAGRRDPTRVLGYPFVPALFIAVAAVLLYYTFRENWPDSFYGLLVILAGVPVFEWFRRRRVTI